uniref:Uncharacterized protein n=1 Tax=Human herpesvirus 1 TaxID=10298 RepID=A0A2Z4H9E1_HHV1|nr:hypothetical protein [Human alphaherpesvirus 1]
MLSRKVSAISRAHDMLPPPDEQEAVHATVAAGRPDEDVPPAGRHERG